MKSHRTDRVGEAEGQQRAWNCLCHRFWAGLGSTDWSNSGVIVHNLARTNKDTSPARGTIQIGYLGSRATHAVSHLPPAGAKYSAIPPLRVVSGEVGLSRSAFADRFTRDNGEPLKRYRG
jgi:AraC-like DNA-binding protein